jgi:PAS domain S-box-containing protein
MDATDFVFDTADGVLAVDQDQRIVLWNGGAYTVLGFKPEEVMGRFCYEVMGGRDDGGQSVCQMACRNIMAIRRQELAQNQDLLVRTKSGQEIWVNVSTIRPTTRREDLSVLIHLFRDVSRQKETERLVKQLFASVTKLSLHQKTDRSRPPAPSPPQVELTDREREVLRLLFSGSATKAIAKKLSISPSTARNHINNILAKLGVHSRLEAVTLALRNDLI